ncbi:MAG: DUF4919 domain-containing protein [Opitutales bacterium]|nr:DUF4919 domain-containing protein [Opitutales bacterium]
MKERYVWLWVAVLAPCGWASVMSAEEAERVYLRSVERLMQGDTDVDYTALREAYAVTRPYEAELLARLKARADLFFRMEEWGEASRLGIEMIERNPVFAEAHMLLRGVYQAVDEPEEAAFHGEIARGLIDSVLASGDGRSERTAFAVVDDSEVRMLSRIHGWVESGRSNYIRDGRAWLTLDLIHPEKRTVYFRVLRPLPPEDDDDD